jgi:hypothetical protein
MAGGCARLQVVAQQEGEERSRADVDAQRRRHVVQRQRLPAQDMA